MLVDFAVLYRYCMNDSALASRLLDTFIAHVPRTLEQLERSRCGEPREFMRLAHQLKSSAAQIGAGSMAALAGELECLGEAEQLPSPEVDQLLEKLRRETARSLDWIREHRA